MYVAEGSHFFLHTLRSITSEGLLWYRLEQLLWYSRMGSKHQPCNKGMDGKSFSTIRHQTFLKQNTLASLRHGSYKLGRARVFAHSF